jgi:FADH2 O2-dependent halogenase
VSDRRERTDVLVVGSGFGGSLLARALRARGRDVLLVERDAHPRFALGESSTPLANIALERLAGRYGLSDLRLLAAWGRWRRELPHLRRGLKRGFTFYAQPTGAPFVRAPRDANRLLVAASPDDEIADTQWLRADVDAHLVGCAVAEGVRYLDRCELRACSVDAERVRCEGLLRRPGGDVSVTVEASFVVDASGPGGFLTRSLALPERARPARFATRLLFGHFDDVPPFAEVVPSLPPPDAPGEPFPETWAAVHHLLDTGWMYQLRFDDDLVSAGFVVDEERAARVEVRLPFDEPARAFELLLERYPSVGAQHGRARPARPIAATGTLQRRLERVAGERWALLPQAYAFYSPLFSTGIAWTLLGVERLAAILGDATDEADSARARLGAGLARYAELVEREADHQEALLAAAYPLLHDLPRFGAVASLYFAAASFGELRQRLLDPREGGAAEGWCWQGFLGASDPLLRAAFEEAPSRARSDDADALRRWASEAIAPRDVIGLLAPARPNLFPVEIPPLLAASRRLGLERDELERRLPRLRGAVAVDSAARR